MGQTLASLECLRPSVRATPIYAVVGEEDYLRDRAVAALRNAVLGDETPTGFNDDVFHGDESAVEDVLACAAEIPVLRRDVVVFKTLDKLAARVRARNSYPISPSRTRPRPWCWSRRNSTGGSSGRRH
ncbi:MAG: hypothetical protein U0231_05690 [Nitrospiraceae bacterium]